MGACSSLQEDEIAYLRAQLEEKNKTIDALQAQVSFFTPFMPSKNTYYT